MINKLSEYIDKNYSIYLHLLKQLVSMNTVYDNRKGLYEGLDFCKDHFEKYLTNYLVYFDSQHNLICKPKRVNNNKNILYLSAHIDTVLADKKEWDKKYNPFVPFEDEKEIVGRGVNDCKAGVAYELFLSTLITKQFSKTTNIVFTISAREESAGESAKEIALQIGRQLPISKKIYLITLENNVTVNPPTLAINYGERGSISIEVMTTLNVIKNFLMIDKNNWNPTIIKPLEKFDKTSKEELHQAGGHAATNAREKNLLYQLLMEKDSQKFVFEAGNEKLVSALPTYIIKLKTGKSIKHKIIFDLRTFKKVRDLARELDEYRFTYRFIKKLDFGYNIKEKLFQDELYKKILKIKNNGIRITFEVNPGSTDTGRIYATCRKQIRDIFLPITMGPGSRSQRAAIPPRLTHGVNETFDKQSGLIAIKFISQVLCEMGFVE